MSSNDLIVTNQLDRPLHVVISQNEDWLFADLFVGVASMALSTYGAVNSINEMWSVLKVANVARIPVGPMNKVRDFFRENSFILPPGHTMVASSFDKTNPLNWVSPSGLAGILGGSTMSILFADEELKNVVKVNCETDSCWIATKKGVRRGRKDDPRTPADKGLAYWNGGSIFAGDKMRTNASPSFVRAMDKNILVYRDGNSQHLGNGLLYAFYEDGKFTHQGYLNHDAGDGPGALGHDRAMLVFSQEGKGSQMELTSYIWLDHEKRLVKQAQKWMGHDIKWRPSAAAMNDTTCIMSNHYPGNALMCDVFHGSHETKNTNADTDHEPAVIAFNGKFRVFFVAKGGIELCCAESSDGKNWGNLTNTGLVTSMGVALCEYKGHLVVLYRDAKGVGTFYAYSKDGVKFTQPENPYFGLDIDSAPACIVDNDAIIVIGKQAGFPQQPVSYDMMWASLKPMELV